MYQRLCVSHELLPFSSPLIFCRLIALFHSPPLLVSTFASALFSSPLVPCLIIYFRSIHVGSYLSGFNLPFSGCLWSWFFFSLMMSRQAECFWAGTFSCVCVCMFACLCAFMRLCGSPTSERGLRGYFALMVWCANLQRPPKLWTEEKHTDTYAPFFFGNEKRGCCFDWQAEVCEGVWVCVGVH